jgi:Pentapeptide repeats (9 copies)
MKINICIVAFLLIVLNKSAFCQPDIDPNKDTKYFNLTEDIDNDFSLKTFKYSLEISESKINNDIFFKQCVFDHRIKFINIDFGEQLDFSDANFKDAAIFRGLAFSADVSFDNATFSTYASFSDLIFEKDASMTFNRTRLPDTLVFDYDSKIPEINFTLADFSKEVSPHLISVFKTDISKLWLDYIHFKLYWYNYAHAPLTTEDRETVYELLLKNFKDRGQEESYKALDVEYIDFKYRNNNLSIFSTLSYLWWYYGYHKELIFLWTAVFIIIFSFITYPLLDYLNTKVYTVENIPEVKSRKLLSRLWYSFIYSSTIFFRLTLKIEKIKFSEKRGTIYIIVMYTTGIICLAYLANFVLQK